MSENFVGISREIKIDPIASLATTPQSELMSLIQYDGYALLASLMDSVYTYTRDIQNQRSSVTNNRTDNIHFCRIHHSIFIDGKRGMGKTHFSVNMARGLEMVKREDLLDKFHILPPIDISALEEELMVLPALIAHIVEELASSTSTTEDSIEVDNAVEQIGFALNRESTSNNNGMDLIINNLRSNTIEQRIHIFAKRVFEQSAGKIAVLPIDDIDTNPQIAYALVQILRRYVSTPYILPVVSGNASGFYKAICSHFEKRLGREVNADQIDTTNTCISLMDKVFSSQRRIRLKDFRDSIVFDNINVYLLDDTQKKLKDVVLADMEMLVSNFKIPLLCIKELQYINNLRSLIYYLSVYNESILDRNRLLEKNISDSAKIESKKNIYNRMLQFYFSCQSRISVSTQKRNKEQKEQKEQKESKVFTIRISNANFPIKKFTTLLGYDCDLVKGNYSWNDLVKFCWEEVVFSATGTKEGWLKSQLVVDKDDLLIQRIKEYGLGYGNDRRLVYSPASLIPLLLASLYDPGISPEKFGFRKKTTKDKTTKEKASIAADIPHLTAFELYAVLERAYLYWDGFREIEYHSVIELIQYKNGGVAAKLLWHAATILLQALVDCNNSLAKLQEGGYQKKIHDAFKRASNKESEVWQQLVQGESNVFTSRLLEHPVMQELHASVTCKDNKEEGNKEKNKSILNTQTYKFDPRDYVDINALNSIIAFIPWQPGRAVRDSAELVRIWLKNNQDRKTSVKKHLLNVTALQRKHLFTSKKYSFYRYAEAFKDFAPELYKEMVEFFQIEDIWLV